MAQCPICNAAVWVGQRYCSTCDNYLPHPEEEDHFCPRCGIRVASQQEICHKCKGILSEIAGTPSTALARAGRLLSRIVGIFISTGLIIVLLLVLLFNKSLRPPPLKVTPHPEAASEQTPAATPTPAAETAPSSRTAPAAQEPAVPLPPTTPSPQEGTKLTPPPPVYSVNVHSLALRDGPTISAPKIATLNFEDKVELLDISGDWGRVRDVRRNIIGWSYLRYLQPVAADGPRAIP